VIIISLFNFNSAKSFRLPVDKTLPIIMIGAGTGIAPYRSFWQERKEDKENSSVPPDGLNGNKWGEMFLYFGCRYSKLDELYSDEIEQLVTNGIITSYYRAFSREIDRKKVNLIYYYFF
jgi:sulfite reductase alpha subunit-like flavoprotein